MTKGINVVNVNRKLICEPNGDLTMAMGDKKVPLADIYEGMAFALRRQSDYAKAIDNMRELLREQESKVQKRWEARPNGNE